MPDYEGEYREHADYFGDAPEPLLAQYAHLIPAGGRVLDLGVGQGRNALPLTRQGFAVTGVDLSPAAIEVTGERAEAAGLSLDLWRGDFHDYVSAEPFDAVLALGLLMTLAPGCFRRANGDVRRYFAPNEILDVLPGWPVIHHWEGMGPWHSHGGGEPERHGEVHLVANSPC